MSKTLKKVYEVLALTPLEKKLLGDVQEVPTVVDDFPQFKNDAVSKKKRLADNDGVTEETEIKEAYSHVERIYYDRCFAAVEDISSLLEQFYESRKASEADPSVMGTYLPIEEVYRGLNVVRDTLIRSIPKDKDEVIFEEFSDVLVEMSLTPFKVGDNKLDDGSIGKLGKFDAEQMNLWVSKSSPKNQIKFMRDATKNLKSFNDMVKLVTT